MKNIFIFLFFLFCFVLGQEIVVNGHQTSEFSFQLEQSIQPFDGIEILTASFVVPQNFQSPTYGQKISGLEFQFEPDPESDVTEADQRGNIIRRLSWRNPQQFIHGKISFNAMNSVSLEMLNSFSPFPLSDVPTAAQIYLEPTEQVQSDHPELIDRAHNLTENSETQLEAVRAILHFVVDHLRYNLLPKKYDALFAYRNRLGNCQNYSHVTAAFMRAVGIPVRIVNGITLKKEFSVAVGPSEYEFEMAQGRHSWIEVYFPDLGWIPFDAQQTEFFVSNRFLRIEVGIDNEETIHDGLVKWTVIRPDIKGKPRLEELIAANFIRDEVSLQGDRIFSGPANLLLTPEIAAIGTPPLADRQEMLAEGKDDKDKTLPDSEIDSMEIDYTTLHYGKSVQFGNTQFPRQFDFLKSRLSGVTLSEEGGVLKRNFVVETAEYVTSRNQYAQMFSVERPLLLKKIGLPLHIFGGTGELWLEISEDLNHYPGKAAAASRRLEVENIQRTPGYDWVDFDLSSDGLILSPGKYWFWLVYRGSPIVNWFYTYGKPVGPVEGTRSRPASKETWNKILSYEFNYRVIGLEAIDD